LTEALKELQNFVSGIRKGQKELAGALTYIRICMGAESNAEIIE